MVSQACVSISLLKHGILFPDAGKQGKNNEAIDFFEKAVQSGYSNYKHTLKDTDLDKLRDHKKFKTALQQMREKDFTYILKKSGAYKTDSAPSLPI